MPIRETVMMNVEQAAEAIWTESLAVPDTSYIPDEDRFVTLANGEREELHWRIALARQAFRDRDERLKAQYAIPAHVRCVFCEDSGVVRKRADPLDQPRADGQPCVCTAGETRQAHHQAEERWRRMMPKKMHRWTLETCPNHELVVKVYSWFKTGAAIGILHYFHAAGSRVYFTAVQELLESTKEGFEDKTNLAEHARPLVRAERAHVLVLDDLGAERVTDWTSAAIDNLVRKRYNAERPTIITSNLSAQDFRRRVGPRLLSRLAETSQAIVADGPDYRTDRTEEAFTA
jgi:hypothetical protein